MSEIPVVSRYPVKYVSGDNRAKILDRSSAVVILTVVFKELILLLND